MTYLDHAATTPVLPEVVAAMSAGDVADRQRLVAAHLRAGRPPPGRGVQGDASPRRSAPGPARCSSPPAAPSRTTSRSPASSGPGGPPTRAGAGSSPSALEHHAVLDVVDFLVATEGALVSWLEVDDFGRVHADTLAAAIAENPADVALVTVMWANNEVGTVNPIRELAAVAHGHGIPFHTDAVQALGQLPVDFAAQRRRRADRHRAQGRRPDRRRRAAAAPGDRGGAAAARRRPGARRPVRARWTSPASSASPSPSQDAVDASGRAGRDAGRAARRPDRRRSRRAVPDVVLSGDPGAVAWSTAGRPGCPATPTCASPAARATRC